MRSFLGAILFFPACIISAQSPDAPKLAAQAFPSVVLIIVRDHASQPLSLGSGFVVGPGLVVTNRHVLAGGAAASVKLVGDTAVVPATGIVALDETHDLAILLAPGLRSIPVELQSNPIPAIGERVYAVGNPRGLEGTFSDGIISGIRFVGADSLLQITAPISPGSSGGPVLNEFGKVVGVSVSSIESGQSLNFAIPSQFVSRLMTQQTAARPLVSIKAIKGRPSSLGRSTTPASEGVGLSLFRWPDAYLGNCYLICEFTFSIRNRLQRPVKNVNYLIVFYDADGNPIDTYERTFHGTIQPGLASRESGQVDPSVRKLSARMAFRILDYEFVD